MKIEKDILDELLVFEDACKRKTNFEETSFSKRLINNMEKYTITLEPGMKMYRARYFGDETMAQLRNLLYQWHEADVKGDDASFIELFHQIESLQNKVSSSLERGFYGYNAEESFVNLNKSKIIQGRCNQEHEQCLYAAEDRKTALSEVRRALDERISIATIKVKDPLFLVDFSLDHFYEKDLVRTLAALKFIKSKTADEETVYTYDYSNGICSLVKKMGYDGVVYSSCQNRSKKNYAIYNFNKCVVIESRLYRINNIEYSFEPIGKAQNNN